ncbi:MAG: M15 family metallopeptidase [Paracoccaceae bacterium]|nr:MAG: M15 family metallopeptidase [Paracoccaceae bacterium]
MARNPTKSAPPPNWIVPAVIVAVALVFVPIVWKVTGYVLFTTTGTDGSTAPAVDSGARIEIENLRQVIETLQQRIGLVEQELSRLQNMPREAAPATDPSDPNFIPERLGDNQILDSYAQVVSLAGRRTINEGISVSSPSFLLETFGPPREVLSDDCEPMTNPKLKAMLVTTDVGPIRVSMLQPAVDSLTNVFEKIKATDIDLYNRISTAGALCVRRIRGSQSSVSTHAFGLAVDLNIDGVLDTLGDGRTQLGLTILADFFQAEGWFWGAAFSREDSMHFEVSREMITRWRAEGKI